MAVLTLVIIVQIPYDPGIWLIRVRYNEVTVYVCTHLIQYLHQLPREAAQRMECQKRAQI